jgi:hypothetical protein
VFSGLEKNFEELSPHGVTSLISPRQAPLQTPHENEIGTSGPSRIA